MSLNYSANDTTKNQWQKINCASITCDSLTTSNIELGNNVLEADSAIIANSLNVAGNEYATPDLGMAGYSLHTDGAGSTYWAVDAVGPSGVQYSGPADALNYVAKFNSNDGLTISKSNFTDNATIAKMSSPDALSSVEVKDEDVEVYVDGEKRVELGTIQSQIFSPDGNNNILTNNFFSQISQASNPRVKVDATVSSLISPDQQKSVKVENNEVKIESNGVNRIRVNNGCTCIIAENGNNAIEVQNAFLNLTNGLGVSYTLPLTSSPTLGQILLADNSGNLVFSNIPTPDLLASPDKFTNIQVSNGLISMKNTNDEVFLSNNLFTEIKNRLNTSILKVGGPAFGLSYIYDGETRIVANIGNTILKSPDGDKSLVLDNNSVYIRDVSQNRFLVEPTFTRSYSPNGQTVLGVEDGQILGSVSTVDRFRIDNTNISLVAPNLTSTYGLTNDVHLWNHTGTGRMEINAGQTLLFSPSRANNIEITDTNTTIKGDLRTEGQILARNSDNSVIPLDVDAPLGQTADLLSLKVDGAIKARVAPDGFANFSSIFTYNTNVIGTVDSATLTIGPSTHTQLDIGYSGAPTNIRGAVSMPNGLTIGASPNQYAFPLTKGTEGQSLVVNDAFGTLAYSLNQIYGNVQAETTASLILTNQNQYYTFPNNTTANIGSDNFLFTLNTTNIQYTGSYTLFLRCSAHASIKRTTGGGGDVCNIAILKNGVKQTGSSRVILDDNNNFPLETSLETVISVSTGDTLTLGMENEDAPLTTFDIYSYSFVVSKI